MQELAMDITHVYQEAVREIATRSGTDQARMSKISLSLLSPPKCNRAPFISTALEILDNIRTMQTFIIRHRQDYTDPHRRTERERDDIEHEVLEFIRTSKQRIELLKNSIASPNSSEAQAKGWSRRGTNNHIVAHQHGVVLILSEKLHAVTAAFDRLRAARFREVLERAQPRRRRGIRSLRGGEAPVGNLMHSSRGGQSGLPGMSNGLYVREQDGGNRLEQAVLDNETQALQAELSSLLDSSKEAEKKVLEMSALSHTLATHVLHQSQQIEQLYNQAVAATSNLNKGNKELAKAISHNSDSRVLVILCFAVLIFAVLFLDWYDSR